MSLYFAPASLEQQQEASALAAAILHGRHPRLDKPRAGLR
jgi:hypothetical protein